MTSQHFLSLSLILSLSLSHSLSHSLSLSLFLSRSLSLSLSLSLFLSRSLSLSLTQDHTFGDFCQVELKVHHGLCHFHCNHHYMIGPDLI